jgi:flagellar motor component MotA
MDATEYEKNVSELGPKIIEFAAHVRKEGILAMEYAMEKDPIFASHPIFRAGFQLSVDGSEEEFINQWFANIRLSTNTDYDFRYLEMLRQGILTVHHGDAPGVVKAIVESFTLSV